MHRPQHFSNSLQQTCPVLKWQKPLISFDLYALSAVSSIRLTVDIFVYMSINSSFEMSIERSGLWSTLYISKELSGRFIVIFSALSSNALGIASGCKVLLENSRCRYCANIKQTVLHACDRKVEPTACG